MSRIAYAGQPDRSARPPSPGRPPGTSLLAGRGPCAVPRAEGFGLPAAGRGPRAAWRRTRAPAPSPGRTVAAPLARPRRGGSLQRRRSTAGGGSVTGESVAFTRLPAPSSRPPPVAFADHSSRCQTDDVVVLPRPRCVPGGHSASASRPSAGFRASGRAGRVAWSGGRTWPCSTRVPPVPRRSGREPVGPRWATVPHGRRSGGRAPGREPVFARLPEPGWLPRQARSAPPRGVALRPYGPADRHPNPWRPVAGRRERPFATRGEGPGRSLT